MAATPTVPLLSITDDLEAGFSGGSRRSPAPPSSAFTNRILMMRRKPSYRSITGIFSEEPAAAAEGGGEHFLDSCFLCRRMLGGNRDIFMYRGDTPFCSEECRQEQIEIDEASEKRRRSSKNKNTLSPAASIKNNGGQPGIRVRPGSNLVVAG